MIAVAIALALLPFAAMADLWRLAGPQPGMGLPQRNIARATLGGFVLTLVITLSLSVRLDPPLGIAALAVGGIALLYLLVGAGNSRGAPFDIMAAIWWSVSALFWGGLLIAVVMPLRVPTLGYPVLERVSPFVHPVLMAGCVAAGVASALRVALMMWPAPGAKLPNPAKVPGMPIAGPASTAAAHAAMSRSGTAPRPKFKT